MRRRAIIGALLLVGVGVVLGATVFRTDIAQATGLAQAVTIDNTTANPVPVREQNLDGSNIRVHEEGTANVNVTNSLVLAPPTPVTAGGGAIELLGGDSVPIGPVTATALWIWMDAGVVSLHILNSDRLVVAFREPTGGTAENVDFAVPLSRPIRFNGLRCVAPPAASCTVSWVGAEPKAADGYSA